MRLITISVALCSGLLALTANANPVYCPQTTTCQINSGGVVTSCSGMSTGWIPSSTTTNGTNFRQGKYQFKFSAAQSSNGSSNCNYVTKSTVTSAEAIVTLSNNTWRSTQTVTNKWQSGSYGAYCYAAGLWYDTINNSSACPFVG